MHQTWSHGSHQRGSAMMKRPLPDSWHHHEERLAPTMAEWLSSAVSEPQISVGTRCRFDFRRGSHQRLQATDVVASDNYIC